ncbi:MAG: hypothetical protein ACRDTH_29240 [Pseudonocardiaceae bacterium]
MKTTPEQRSGAPPPRERPAPDDSGRHQATRHVQDTAASTSVAAPLRRRRAASYRCPPLADGRRDPLDPVHPDTWTDAELESWAAAAVHLRRAGLTPQVPHSVRRSWYARRSCRCNCRGDAA